MNQQALRESISRRWKDSIVERLQAYVRIPNKSPMFDPDWEKAGHMRAAADLMAAWCREQGLKGAKVEILARPGLTPVLLVDIEGKADDLYGDRKSVV